mmetsp:Transcript_11453/g.29779  ORF Transcript_11453/g.29779 Transcript_11453/m.29779 type:complete len:288 (+) Transcript_11453:87-950(+)
MKTLREAAPADVLDEDDDGDVHNPTDADRASKFVRKLYQMVCNPQIDDHIAWTPQGDAIQILRPAAFARDVLPLYFKHSNMRSFIRQLNMYGFRRRGKGSRVIEFIHRRFQRGNERDLATISRNHAAVDDGPPSDLDAGIVAALQGEVQRMAVALEEARARLFALEQTVSSKLAGGQGAPAPTMQGGVAPPGLGIGAGWAQAPAPQWVYVPPAPPSAQVLGGPQQAAYLPSGHGARPSSILATGAPHMGMANGDSHVMGLSATGMMPTERVAVVVSASAGMPQGAAF